MVLEKIVYALEVFGAIFSGAYLLVYILLGGLTFLALKDFYRSRYLLKNQILAKSNHTTGISIVAPAYNETVTIVSNIKSLLAQEYPKFEVIIINDGSTDDTLEKIIAEFELVKVNFYYKEKIVTKQVRGHYKSTNPIYSKLLVVDKVNGGCKADASNSGINSAKYPLFVCTDVDCILRRDTLATLVKPFLESGEKVIAAGAMIRISNACEFLDGMLYRSHFPSNFFARFQELEYIRSYLYGRMAWSKINGLLLVSGGLGIFRTETAIQAGGYWPGSLGEDFELILRMRMLMEKSGEPFSIKYVPESLCWTEVPSTLKVFFRQRTRWARGLVQTLVVHRKVMGNKKYGITGLVAFPYFVLFEFLVPLVEVVGVFVLLANIWWFDLDQTTMYFGAMAIYLFYTTITLLSVLADQFFYRHYSSVKEIVSLIVSVLLEPIVYHPLNVIASVNGYFHFMVNRKKKWGAMERKGFKNPVIG